MLCYKCAFLKKRLDVSALHFSLHIMTDTWQIVGGGGGGGTPPWSMSSKNVGSNHLNRAIGNFLQRHSSSSSSCSLKSERTMQGKLLISFGANFAWICSDLAGDAETK